MLTTLLITGALAAAAPLPPPAAPPAPSAGPLWNPTAGPRYAPITRDTRTRFRRRRAAHRMGHALGAAVVATGAALTAWGWADPDHGAGWSLGGPWVAAGGGVILAASGFAEAGLAGDLGAPAPTWAAATSLGLVAGALVTVPVQLLGGIGDPPDAAGQAVYFTASVAQLALLGSSVVLAALQPVLVERSARRGGLVELRLVPAGAGLALAGRF